jgi:hypothetical protein
MKKLLILLLVLCLASTSFGVYTYSLNDIQLEMRTSGTVTIVGNVSLAGGEKADLGIYEEESPSQGSVSGTGSILGSPATAGALASIDVYTSWNGLDITFGSTGLESPAWDAAAGDWFSFAYSGNVGDTINIYDYAVSNSVPVGTLDIIPEPMTIALLGLGGLFLRRRK